MKRYYVASEEVFILSRSMGSGGGKEQVDTGPYRFVVYFESGLSNQSKTVRILSAKAASSLGGEYLLEDSGAFPITIEAQQSNHYEGDRPETYPVSYIHEFGNELDLDWDADEKVEITLQVEITKENGTAAGEVILPMVPTLDEGGSCGTYD